MNEKDGKVKWGYEGIVLFGEGQVVTEVSVRRWPDVLIDTVKAGLAALADR